MPSGGCILLLGRRPQCHDRHMRVCCQTHRTTKLTDGSVATRFRSRAVSTGWLGRASYSRQRTSMGGGRRLMTDLAQGQVTRPQVTRPQVKRPSRAIVDQSGSRPVPQEVRPAVGQEEPVPDSGRATARAALDAALSGVELTATDRRFLARLSQWDKRTATTMASLVMRARESGQREAAVTDPDGCPWCGRC